MTVFKPNIFNEKFLNKDKFQEPKVLIMRIGNKIYIHSKMWYTSVVPVKW